MTAERSSLRVIEGRCTSLSTGTEPHAGASPRTLAPVPSDDDGLLDRSAASRHLGLSERAVSRRAARGEIGVASRRPLLFRRADLDDYLERCRVKAGALSHLNAYAGRPETGVAEWLRTKKR